MACSSPHSSPHPMLCFSGVPRPSNPSSFGPSHNASSGSAPSTSSYTSVRPTSSRHETLTHGFAQQAGGPRIGGRKRALMIGINYENIPSLRLNGCINDTNRIRALLTKTFGFCEDDILCLTDDVINPVLKPTKANILEGMKWLVQGVQAGDCLFFSFSGHGGQQRNKDGTEVDGQDETLFPMDVVDNGEIIDDEIHRILAQSIPVGAKLTAVIDCCHSGTSMDLPYIYSSGRMVLEDIASASNRITRGEVVLFSGCRDNQVSQDSKVCEMMPSENGVAILDDSVYNGVLTFAFCQAVQRNPSRLTYSALMNEMMTFAAANKFRQLIQLSSGRELKLDAPFSILF